MSETKRWVDIGNGISAAFSLPCREHYYYVRVLRQNIGCPKPDEKHGHIELECEDGWTFVPFCCRSQAGVRAVVRALGEDEYKGILDMDEVKSLPEELTEEERAVIDSPDEMERQAHFHWWVS